MSEQPEQGRSNQPYIVGLRFQPVGKLYHFDASNYRGLKPGDYAVVETSRGRQLGQVIQVVAETDPSAMSSLKPVIRPATPQDLLLRQSWEKKEIEAVVQCRAKAADLKISDVKIVSAEYSFDGNKLYFMFSSEAGEKADVKSLRRAMQRLYPQTHVEMHLVGPRDVAKILGGMGACGLVNRCCSIFLTEFSPISIKMAKEQGISLTPTEITGMCGRLRCCLVYEYEQYVEARKQLPKRGKAVQTPMGTGKVVEVLTLKGSIVVELDQGGQHEYLHHEIQPLEELEAFRSKAEKPCDKHPEGGCSCGKSRLKNRND